MIEERDEEGFVECFDPNCEFLLPRNLLEGGSYKGDEGIRRALADVYASWESVRFEIEDIRTIGSRVVVMSRTTNVARDGGPPITYPTAYLYEMRGGRILYFRPYQSRAEALEAAGLSEYGDTASSMADRDQEIIESLRRTYEAFSRGDFDAAIELAHPEIEFIPPGGQSALRGADAVRAWMEPEAIEDQRIEPREFRVNGDKALVRHHVWGRGAGSGIEVEVEMWAVWTLNEDLLVTRMEAFLIDQEREALHAAGLAE